MRYSLDEKDGGDTTFAQWVGEGDGFINRAEDENWDAWTWRLGIDHNLDENTMLYAFVATGYRARGASIS